MMSLLKFLETMKRPSDWSGNQIQEMSYSSESILNGSSEVTSEPAFEEASENDSAYDYYYDYDPCETIPPELVTVSVWPFGTVTVNVNIPHIAVIWHSNSSD